MTTSHLPRRAIIGTVLAAGLIGGGLAAFAEDAPAGPCMTFTDKAGDSAPADAPVPAPEDDLDLTGVAFDTIDGKLLLSVFVKKLNVAPEYSFGDSFAVTFKHGGKAIEAYAYRYNPSQIGTALQAAYSQTGLKVNGSTKVKDIKVTYDQKASKVLFTVLLADLDKASGLPSAGAAFSTLAAEAAGDNIAFAEPWDTATAPKDMTYTVGSLCGGGAAAPTAPVVATAPEAAPAPAPAAGGGDPSKLPNADCSLAKDPKGDAHVFNASVPNDPDLDLTALTLGSDAKNLYAYLKADKLAAGPAMHDGHRFYVNFTHNKHNFTMAGSAYKNAGSAQLKDGLANSGQVAHVTQLAVDGVTSATDPARFTGAGTGCVPSGLKFVFDQKASIVTAILPLADIEKYGKAPVAGETLTSVYGSNAGDSYAVANPADAIPDGATSPATSKITYSFGDNSCFPAGISPLSSVGAVTAQYGDSAAVAAKLVDAAGAPVSGKPVTFTLGASQANGTTGADGIAKATLLVKELAGTRTLTIAADGNTVTVDFTVLVEKTVLKAANTKGTVVATLTDDDKSPVAGQLITFTIGSKKATAKTDAKGVAKVTGFPAGNVKVTYAGATGMYTAANATSMSSN